MSIRFSFGSGLIRAAVSLVFFGSLVVQGTSFGDTATSESPSVFSARSTGQGDSSSFHFSDSIADQVTVGLPDEFGVTLEDDDSLEVVRVDIQRRPFDCECVDGLKIVSDGARNARPDISLPLLL